MMMFCLPAVLTLNWTPAVLLPTVEAGYEVLLQPELSLPLEAGSVLLPVKKAWVVPPTRVAAPTPRDGLVVPVPTVASGMGLLKSHWATTEDETAATVRDAAPLLVLPKELDIITEYIPACAL